MSKRFSYSYSVLRYVHDVATEEFINVGVAVFCPDSNDFFKVICRKNVGRVANAFPNLNKKTFRSLMKTVLCRFEVLSNEIQGLALEEKGKTLVGLLSSVMPQDDSSLVWGSEASGLTNDPEAVINDLFERYVMVYESKSQRENRTDDEIWRRFKKELEDRKIDQFFQEKVIEGQIDEVKFKQAWKNGAWHCVQSLSFDLSVEENLKEKARAFLGHIMSVSDAIEEFKLYLILAKPSDRNLEPAFQSALKILEKLPVKPDIYLEADTDILANFFEEKIENHELGHKNYEIGVVH